MKSLGFLHSSPVTKIKVEPAGEPLLYPVRLVASPKRHKCFRYGSLLPQGFSLIDVWNPGLFRTLTTNLPSHAASQLRWAAACCGIVHLYVVEGEQPEIQDAGE
jgi:hypothetical protein